MSKLGDTLRKQADIYQRENDQSTFYKLTEQLKTVVDKGGRELEIHYWLREDITQLFRDENLFVFYAQNQHKCDCNYRESCGHHPQHKTCIKLDNVIPTDMTFIWKGHVSDFS